jgi:hypothetical protein
MDDGTGGSTELLEGVRARIAAGDRDGAAALFLRVAGTPAEVLPMIRQSPGWPRMLDLAPALVYDITLCNGGVVPRERLAGIGVPTVAVSGAASSEWAARAGAAVAGAVPGARHVVLDGQTHAVAHDAIARLLIDSFGAGSPT